MTKRTIHEKIIFATKVVLFTAFAYNTVRVVVRTWKYGGITGETFAGGTGEVPSNKELSNG